MHRPKLEVKINLEICGALKGLMFRYFKKYEGKKKGDSWDTGRAVLYNIPFSMSLVLFWYWNRIFC